MENHYRVCIFLRSIFKAHVSLCSYFKPGLLPVLSKINKIPTATGRPHTLRSKAINFRQTPPAKGSLCPCIRQLLRRVKPQMGRRGTKKLRFQALPDTCWAVSSGPTQTDQGGRTGLGDQTATAVPVTAGAACLGLGWACETLSCFVLVWKNSQGNPIMESHSILETDLLNNTVTSERLIYHPFSKGTKATDAS